MIIRSAACDTDINSQNKGTSAIGKCAQFNKCASISQLINKFGCSSDITIYLTYMHAIVEVSTPSMLYSIFEIFSRLPKITILVGI